MVTTELPTGPLRGLQWGWPRAPDPVEWGKEQVPASQWSVEADVPPPTPGLHQESGHLFVI